MKKAPFPVRETAENGALGIDAAILGQDQCWGKLIPFLCIMAQNQGTHSICTAISSVRKEALDYKVNLKKHMDSTKRRAPI
jgi:hypothetical protein